MEKVRKQIYPLQMTDIPDRPFDKIAIDLVTDVNLSTSGNQHILTIIDHLTRLARGFSNSQQERRHHCLFFDQ